MELTLLFLAVLGLRYPKVGNGAQQQHHKLEQMSNPQLPDLLNGEFYFGGVRSSEGVAQGGEITTYCVGYCLNFVIHERASKFE